MTMRCPVCSHENPDDAPACESCGAKLGAETEDVAGLVGQTVGGRYRVVRVLAAGGMGVVYEAEQPMGAHVRRVALKTLRPSLSHDRAVEARFYRECGTVAQLEHPNTIRFFDFGQTDTGLLYIVMELIVGQSLSDATAHGPLPLERVRHIVRQIAGALHEAHELGVVHRDLKPDNIFLSSRPGREDFVKLLDFGIAARTGASSEQQTKLTQHGMVLGTPPYMSPEQLAGGVIDRRSDVYALGIIVYEMLSGRLPFHADTPWQWAYQHMMVAPEPLPDTLPAPVRETVARALAKDPVDRPLTVTEFAFELGALSEDEAGLAAGAPRRAETSELVKPALNPAAAAPLEAPRQRTEPMPTEPERNLPALPRFEARPPRKRRFSRIALALLLVSGGALAVTAIARRDRPPEQPALDAPPQVTEIAPLVEDGGATDAAAVEPDAPTPEPKPPPAKEPARPRIEPAPAPKQPPPPLPVPPPVAAPDPTPPPQTTPLPSPPPATTPSPVPPPPTALPPQRSDPPRVGWPFPLPLPSPGASTEQPKPAPPNGQPGAPVGDAACTNAVSLAGSENIEGAVAMYRRCQETGGSAAALGRAKSRIRSGAASAVRHRSLNNDCAAARSAVTSASAIGAGDLAARELARSDCRS